MSQTGEHPAVVEHPPVPELEIISARSRKTLTDVRWLLALSLGGIAAVVAATVSTVAFAQDAGTKAAVEETRVVKAQAEATATDYAEFKKDQLQMNREILRRLDENAADTRALYKTVLTGERQYRLERPPQLPDGGP